ncbi:Down syndrome cell adhesion molecule homolog isoform X2 [Nematostella vectensis]|uniref:Down syndrome cell adhesion molecule homolog isoform X2 n=1 Tax=Nematostella vectensis TaxID=45351 RepID=UPI0020777536|nr:Down syndrome cell adhesion molecule homolog isoform X2 [Nematostella vectensis]
MDECLSLGSHYRILLCFVGLLSLSFTFIECSVRFTEVPSEVLYVSNGSTAKLTWRYSTTNRSAELSEPSITWSFYESSNASGVQLAEEKQNKTWTISGTCPDRLRARLKQADSASIIIVNVTLEDNGIYECSLRTRVGPTILNTTQLVVTVRPKLSVPVPSSINILEGEDLSQQCAAVGPPRPRVGWDWITGEGKVFRSKGLDSTTLSISNIRREQAGTYLCSATNNPNETPITATMIVIVEYRPVIDSAGSSHDVISWDNNTIYLQCLVSGKPAPRITWFDPKGGEVKVGVMILPDRGVLAVMTQAPEDYGEYRCNVKNSHGFDNYYVQVTKLGLPGPPRLSITEKDIEARTITVRWTANPHANAPVDYRVEIGDKTPREGVRGNSVVISGLDKDTEYLVRVTARNQAGYGNSSQVIVRTKKEDPVVTVTSCSTAVAVCVPIIILLIIVIVLMALYIWRNNKRTKYILLSVKRYAMESVKDGEKKGTENIYEIALESNSSAGNPRPSDDPNKNYRQNGVPKSGRRRRRRRPVDILTSIEEEASGEQIQEVDEEVLETEDFVCEENTEVNNETPSVSVNENGGKTVVSVDVHDSAA